MLVQNVTLLQSKPIGLGPACDEAEEEMGPCCAELF